MKLLVISGARIVGGAERSTLLLVRELTARGFEITVACPAGGEFARALATAPVKFYPAPLGGALNFAAIWHIGRALARLQPELLLIPTSDEWVFSCLTPRMRPHRASPRPKLILVRHMALELPRRVRRLAAARADAIVAVSQTVARSLGAGGAIPGRLLHVILNGARFAVRSAPPTAQQRREARRRLNLPAQGRLLGFMGGLYIDKGIEDLLEATRRLAPSLSELNVLICGRADHRRDAPDLPALASRFGLAGQVHYLGQLDQVEQVQDAFTAADAIVVATHQRLGESLSQTALDAMSLGTPLVAYALDGLLEAVGPSGEAALLAVPDDIASLAEQLDRVLGDPVRAASLAQAGLERARTIFAPARMADSYVRLFEQLTGSGLPGLAQRN